eukprot:gene804-873_t
MRPAEIDSYDEYLVAGRPPRKRFPIRTTIAGVVLFLGGIIFLAVGLSIMFSSTRSHGKDRGTLLVILGSVMFLPGSYASVIIYGSFKGWPGYDYSLIPSYDDE